MRRLSMMLAALFLVNAVHAAVPFWGDKASMPANTPPTALKQGQLEESRGCNHPGSIVQCNRHNHALRKQLETRAAG